MIKFEDVRPGDVFLRNFNPTRPMLMVVRNRFTEHLTAARYNVSTGEWFPRILIMGRTGAEFRSRVQYIGNLSDHHDIQLTEWAEFFERFKEVGFEY